MDLKPAVGIDQIEFGMKQPEVEDLLGHPQATFVEDDDPDRLVLQYNRFKTRLTFYGEEEGRLGYIRCADPALTYTGSALIGQSVNAVMQLFEQVDDDEWDVESHQFFDSYFCERLWLVLNVEYGEVTDVEIGVPFKNEEQYDWKR